jgi:hypothetical protein
MFWMESSSFIDLYQNQAPLFLLILRCQVRWSVIFLLSYRYFFGKNPHLSQTIHTFLLNMNRLLYYKFFLFSPCR